MGKKRFAAEKISQLLTLFPAVGVIGPRQCGKSTLLRSQFPDWRYYDLERPDDFQLITNDPLVFFRSRREKVIIDEAQRYPPLFGVLRGVIDADREARGRFLLSGSSSPAIVKGLSESLAGRLATVELSPFKMAEFEAMAFPAVYRLLVDPRTEAQDFTGLVPGLTQNQVFDHWLWGGYPEPRIRGIAEPHFLPLWMDAYYGDFVQRDIQSLFPRINNQNFRRFIHALEFQSGHQINHSAIARALELSSVTIREYLQILHNTFIWRNLEIFEGNSVKKVQKMAKGFFRDSGLLHHHLKIGDLDSLLVHPIAGKSFESFVIEELVRGLRATLEPSIDFYFYRTRDRSEIDLIIEGRFGLIPVEVKLGSIPRRGDLMAMKAFLEETKARYGLVINNSDRCELLSPNIVQIPVGVC